MTTNKVVSTLTEKQVMGELSAIRKWRESKRTRMKKQPGKKVSKTNFYTMFEVTGTKKVVLASTFGDKFLFRNKAEAKEMLKKDHREATLLRAMETHAFKGMSFNKPDE